MIKKLVIFGLFALIACSEARGAGGKKGGTTKKVFPFVAVSGPSVGTAARTWQHAWTFGPEAENGGCVASPDYNTITDNVGTVDVDESAAVTYTCNVAITGLDGPSIGITVAMNVDGACWETAAGGFPEVPDGDDLLVRFIGMDNVGQGGNRRLISTQLSGNDLWYMQRNSLERNAWVFEDNNNPTTLIFTTNGVTAQWRTWDFHFDDGTNTLSNCRSTDCITTTITDPAAMPARQLGLFDNFTCTGGANLLDDTDVAGVWISYCSSGCAAADWTALGMHADDCASDGTC